MARAVSFEIVGGALLGKEGHIRVQAGINLDRKRIVIRQHDVCLFGMAKECHVRLPDEDPLVSRHHFLVECAPPRAILRDLGSLHGTHVNGKRYGGRTGAKTPGITAPHAGDGIVLRDGDQVTIGQTTFLVRMEQGILCGSCGKEQDERESGDNTETPWRCSSCVAASRKSGATRSANRPRVCCECGGPAAREAEQTPEGFALCDECARQSAARPAERLARLLRHAGREDRGAELPSIPGYTLLELLGQGGSGTVYRGLSAAEEVPVAIKVLRPSTTTSPRERLEFLRETETAKGLAHPNIVTLLDHGIFQGVFYLVTEYCAGGNAEALLARSGGSLPATQVTRIGLEVLDALAFIHQADQVHRDVKPANVLLWREADREVAKLADFGLAKNFQLAGFSGMTIAGQFAGTFEFMPREQLTGYRFMKPSSDVWSLAATLYHLLTGSYPYDFPQGQDKAAVVLESKIVPMRHRGADLPVPLAAVIDRALSPRPEQRFPNAAEMRKALLLAATPPAG